MRRIHPLLRRLRKGDPDPPVELPLPLGPRITGEFFMPRTGREAAIRRHILRESDSASRRHDLDRRSFLASSFGMALSLAAVNWMQLGCSEEGGAPDCTWVDAGPVGGRYIDCTGSPVSPDCPMPIDPADVFVFDVQNHHVERIVDATSWSFFRALRVGCPQGLPDCLLRNEYIDQVFIQSDTDVAMLSAIPAVGDELPLDSFDIADTRDIVNALAGSERLLGQGQVLPNKGLQAELDGMEEIVALHGVSAWKLHTAWGPRNRWRRTGDGYWMDDPAIGIPVVEKALELGVPTICVHKGFPSSLFSSKYTAPHDAIRVARDYPEIQMVVYHSALRYAGGICEGPYQEGSRLGVNSMITAMRNEGIGPGENVHAELGSTWSILIPTPNQAAHVLGKLLLHVGEDNILWGTDAIWNGSPQGQLEAFLNFEITEAYQDRYGYPALTFERKQKILGLNAARLFGVDPDAMLGEIVADDLTRARMEIGAALGERRWVFQSPAGSCTPRVFNDRMRRQAASGRPG